MMEFQMWAEGAQEHIHTEEACFIDVADGEDFLEACEMYADEHPGFGEDFMVFDNIPYHMGVRLFDNERDARVAYG
jgi:hypothetical protein